MTHISDTMMSLRVKVQDCCRKEGIIRQINIQRHI
jgi:hypothetical protein